MKKLTLMLSLAVASFAAHAEIVTPTIFSENFMSMGQKGDFIKAPWTTYGVTAKPSLEVLDEYFIDADKNIQIYGLLQYNSETYAISNNLFEGNLTADQWLVTPDIKVDSDVLTLSFTGAFYNGKGYFTGNSVKDINCPFEVYVSTDGVAKEAFNPVPVYSGVQAASGTDIVGTKSYVLPLNGYKDKTINLAFVQKGKNVGPFGFTNIYLGNYYIDIQNLTPVTLDYGQQISVDANVGIKTSDTCPGVDVVVELDGKVVKEDYVAKRYIDNASKGLIYIRLTYEDLGAIGDDAVAYKISITPRMENAKTSYVTGTIAVPVTTYPNNVVMEEVTASGCQFCPIGNAAMEYYADTYNLPGRGKFIGIAVHGNINYLDPMSIGVSEYLIKSQSLMANTSMPAANFNRSTIGQYPYNTSNASREYSKKSLNKVEIKGVSAPMSLDIDDAIGKTVTVDFDAYSAYNVAEPSLNAAVVLIENDVRGDEDGYSQSNAFYNKDASVVTSSYNAPELVPYMKKYLVGGSLAMSSIPYDIAVYQHVARGIFPYFEGEPINEPMKGDVALNKQISFNIPDNVMDMKNTEVVVLLFDSDTKAIVGSDIFPASSFTDNTGINSVAGESYDWTLAKDGNNLVVSAHAGSSVAVYGVDGALIGHYTMDSDHLTLTPNADGIVIVKVNGSARKVVL